MNNDGNLNPAFAPMFWDSRARSLEEQALKPIESFDEMQGHAFSELVATDSIVSRLQAINRYRH